MEHAHKEKERYGHGEEKRHEAGERCHSALDRTKRWTNSLGFFVIYHNGYQVPL